MTEKKEIDLYSVPEVELIYRNPVEPADRIVVDTSSTAHQILKSTWSENRIQLVEQFKILLLDRRGACLGVSEISSGGINTCIAEPKLIFTTALKANASSLILAHNHPSGNLEASQTDIRLTNHLVEIGKMLEIVIRDHLILTSHGYLSFSDKRMLPT